MVPNQKAGALQLKCSAQQGSQIDRWIHTILPSQHLQMLPLLSVQHHHESSIPFLHHHLVAVLQFFCNNFSLLPSVQYLFSGSEQAFSYTALDGNHTYVMNTGTCKTQLSRNGVLYISTNTPLRDTHLSQGTVNGAFPYP